MCLIAVKPRMFPIDNEAGVVMSESAATSWIIERLEIENTKMEEEMGNMDSCEDGFVGVTSGAT